MDFLQLCQLLQYCQIVDINLLKQITSVPFVVSLRLNASTIISLMVARSDSWGNDYWH